MTSWYIMVFASVYTHSGRWEIIWGDFGATDNCCSCSCSRSTAVLGLVAGLKQYKMVAI